jgi:uncharacterized membrane protein
MTTTAHLWAVGYDDTERADQVREEITRLAWGAGQAAKYLILLDIAVVVRHPDGSFTLDRQPFPRVTNVLACSAAGFLAGLVVAAPLTGAAVGAVVGGLGTAVATSNVGIGDDFVQEVKRLMKPGSSALFVLDNEGDMEMILHTLHGLGGRVLRTNVDLERAELIQSTLAVSSGGKTDTDGRESGDIYLGHSKNHPERVPERPSSAPRS